MAGNSVSAPGAVPGRIRRAVSRLRKRVLGRPWAAVALGVLLAFGAWLVVRGFMGGRDPTWARVQATGVWRVGMDPSFPPFENLDPVTQQPVGLDIDLAAAIAARWGVRVEIVGLGFDQLIDAVHAHKVDSALSALPIVPHRAKEVAFSAPYVDAGIVLAAPAGSAITGEADLAGRRVAVEWGSAADAAARALGRELAGTLQLVLADDANAALDALSAGEADAALVDAISLAQYPGTRELVAVGQPLSRDPYVIMVPADAPDLLGAVNAALAAFEADGTLLRLKARWLKP